MKMKWAPFSVPGICFVIGAGLLWSVTGLARPQYVRMVPTPFQCATCHDDPRNRQFRNGFGIDFATERTVWFNDGNDEFCPINCAGEDNCPPPECSGMCPLDSDGDGLSNGVELGDPDCEWRPGDPIVNREATHPGDPRDPDRCGNDEINPGEECDGEALNDVTCLERGFMEGELGCRADCIFDETACVDFPEPDADIPDAEIIDADLPDAHAMDADVPDAEMRDARPSDGAALDSTIIDANVRDAEFTDGEWVDASREPIDGFIRDRGPSDALPDGGQIDGDMESTQGIAEQGGCSAMQTDQGPWPGFILVGLLLTVTIRIRSSS